MTVDDGMHSDLKSMMEDSSATIGKIYPENSFEYLFWKQQQTASKLSSAKLIRWHPLIIKWCLYLRHLSGKAYETVRSSGCIKLPSQRTLRDYTHYVSAATGFSTAIDKQLAAAADIDNCSEKDKYTVIVMDEMYIKESLVYDKHNGSLIGFTNLGETNNHLLEFKRHVNNNTRNNASFHGAWDVL